MYTITGNIQTFNHSSAHKIQSYIYMAHFPLLPLLIPLCLPFVSPSTYLAPSSCDRNRPPPSQVACKLTLFASPFTELSHPFQIPRTPTAQRLTMTSLGIFRLLLSGTIALDCRLWLLQRNYSTGLPAVATVQLWTSGCGYPRI
jgi:hypothetical protein